MRILSCVPKAYYGRKNSTDPLYHWFRLPLERMGHVVEHFDPIDTYTRLGPDTCGEMFLDRVRAGGYDLVLYSNWGRDCMPPAAIREAGRCGPVVGWNSDDDWQWERYTSQVAPYFTYAVTTYQEVYETNRLRHPNLLLSQWACLDAGTNADRPKDLGFTFVGQVYRNRVADCRYLRRKAGLRVFGLGAARVRWPLLGSSRVWKWAVKAPGPWSRPLTTGQVHDLWDRSRVSYTPLSAAGDGRSVQIKGRVFEMGLSGTLMLAQRNPDLARYYRPGREFVEYDGPEDCAEKARFYLAHEPARARIAAAYEARTRAEHLWEHRFERLFREIGLAAGGASRMSA